MTAKGPEQMPMTNAATPRTQRRQLPSQDELKRLFSYDRTTGELTRLIGSNPKPYETKSGYLITPVPGIKGPFPAHRIIWKMETGEDPDTIDHINGKRADNRMENMRNVTHKENLQNLNPGSAGADVSTYTAQKQKAYRARQAQKAAEEEAELQRYATSSKPPARRS